MQYFHDGRNTATLLITFKGFFMIICFRVLFPRSVSGKRVLDEGTFRAVSFKFIEAVVREKEPEHGEGFIPKFWLIQLPAEVLPFVSTSIALRSKNPDDYVVHPDGDGFPKLFLDRKFALPPTACFVRVFTKEDFPKSGFRWLDQEAPQFPPHVTHIIAEVIVEDGTWEYKTMSGFGESLPRPSSLLGFLALRGLWDRQKSIDAQGETINRVLYWEEYWSKYTEIAD